MPTVHLASRYGDRRVFSRLVCAVIGGDTAHCEAVTPLGDGQWRCISSSWMDGGPRPKTMPLPREKWRIYRTEVPWSNAEEWLAAQDEKLKGTPRWLRYGWWKLLRFVVPFLRPSWGGPICSEACAEICRMPDSDSYNPRSIEAAVAWQHTKIQ
jgi:hypothetical protein